MSTRFALPLLAAGLAFVGFGGAHAQSAKAPPGSATPAPAADDMAMPDDLGAPLTGPGTPAPSSSPREVSTRVLTVDSPIEQIASNPAGRAVLDRTLPGLCERAEYPMFKSMSLRKVADMSSGRITPADLQTVQTGLTRIGPTLVATAPAHGAFYPLTHTAGYSIHYGGQQIGRFSRSLYHRVVLVVAAM